MSAGRIAIRYATPIIELAEEKKVLEEVKADMESFAGLCRDDKQFALMLKSPIIPHLKKAEILKKIFTGKVNELTLEAFDLITRKSRESLLAGIADAYLHLYNVKKGLAEVSVTTSLKLDADQRKAFEGLAKRMTGKTPILKEKVDPSIVGGYLLSLGDTQLDQTVSGQLKDLKLKFSK
jgi:F-type H+-transporting ATPase subunit delta